MTSNRLPFSHSVLALAIVVACTTGTASSATLNIRGGCTLINAINNANTDTDTDGNKGCPAGSGADTINLAKDESYTLTAVDNNAEGNNGLPSVSSIITINGNGATISRSTATGTPGFRLFHIAPTGTLTLKSATIKHGRLSITHYDPRAYGYGGGLLNRGSVTLINTIVTANFAKGGNGGGIANLGALSLINTTIAKNTTDAYERNGSGGGGIFNKGDLTLKNSTVSGNYAAGFDSDYYGSVGGNGGGILNSRGATLTSSNSTLSGNVCYFNGGGINNYGTMQLKNSTLSGNVCPYGGGGISNNGTMWLMNSTLSDNDGEGISNSIAGTMWLTNTLIANSGGYDNCSKGATMYLNGVNLIEDGSCSASLSGDPMLGALLDNGGPTLTHALLETSPAIDAADLTLCPRSDQRGVHRPSPAGGGCDIGAYERIPIKSTTISTSVLAIVNFFRRQTAIGSIVGVGVAPLADQKQTAALNQLIVTGVYRDQSQNFSACNQLKRLLPRIDTDMTPDEDDYVTGNEAARLATKVSTLRSTWVCPP